MLKSKFFTGMIIATLVFAIAAVTLQVLEMDAYELLQTLWAKWTTPTPQ